MSAIDLRPFLERVERIVERHRLDDGAYARWTRGDERGLDPYGCADAVNLLYTLGREPGGDAERAALRALQDPEDGLFHEGTHHPIHTTAHCIAALELLDARPAHPLRALADTDAPGALEAFLEGLDWKSQPWTEAHRGAGLYAARVLAGEADAAWEERYFAWLDAEQDGATGLLRRGCVPPLAEGEPVLFAHLAGTFHYLFNMQWRGRPLRHPAALVETCLAIRQRRIWPLVHYVGFAEIDWVYCLHRAVRQCGYRQEEALGSLAGLAVQYVPCLESQDDAALDDLHTLFGAVCALAELQAALPDRLQSEVPLRLVLDRRPFI